MLSCPMALTVCSRLLPGAHGTCHPVLRREMGREGERREGGSKGGALPPLQAAISAALVHARNRAKSHGLRPNGRPAAMPGFHRNAGPTARRNNLRLLHNLLHCRTK